MSDLSKMISKTSDLSDKVGQVFLKRAEVANKRFEERIGKAVNDQISKLTAKPLTPWDIWKDWVDYSVDFSQRSILFWDTLRSRGNTYMEHEKAGKPPVLHFEYEMVMDGRQFERPVNYSMVRIIAPAGVTVINERRPYIIIDPRAGHGPGIGGFKDDSQVGAALHDGCPVYFVIFYPDPMSGQTLLDVCAAEKQFVHKVRELHPKSPKPALIGNCQGGWAAMMLATSDPDETGPIVINGAPMSYWGGAWSEGEGDNPMRYAGGLLGGTWLSSLSADMGKGIFDGAYLVQNMENLNPANTFWDKYYHLFANIDTEPPRFLEFERWWGGFYLLNKEEIEWIVQNLFVGNKLWSGDVKNQVGGVFDLKQIKSPIILFASLGDNITPPQQAFNWVADVYGSTDEIKARGQVIIGLLHENIGHLGIFVSGKVAKKEHTQIVSVLKSIEALPPGLYGMNILENKNQDGKLEYSVEFVEHQLEDVINRLNRFKRQDEKPFQALEKISEFNQNAYELFAQPIVKAMTTDFAAKLGRDFHPLRFQRWAVSDLNPWLAWLGPTADLIKDKREPAAPDQSFRIAEKLVSEFVSASFDFYRDLRDAISEAQFFQTYGALFDLYLSDQQNAKDHAHEIPADHRNLPFVREALASIDTGGYAEAVCRTGYLLERKGIPITLSSLEVKHELMEKFKDLLPDLKQDERRRLRGEQEIICRYEPEKALETLPKLLADPNDKKRFKTLLDRLLADPRFAPENLTPEQRGMVERIQNLVFAKKQKHGKK
jgi:pimeloyl-ACP methyl ester carboxylesterase